MSLKRRLKDLQKLGRISCVRTFSLARELAWLRTRLHLPRNDFLPLETSAKDGIWVREVDAASSFERELPRLPGEVEPHETFLKEQRGVFPRTVVAEISQGRFWGFYGGSVFAEDGRMISEFSKDVWGPQLHSAFLKINFPKPRHLKGSTLSLVTPEAASNYHHWTIDLLPRAGLVERAGYRLADFDHVLIKDRGLPFQKEGLKRLGLRSEQILQVDPTIHIVADRLVVPSMREDTSLVGPADLKFVRQLYLPTESKQEKPFRKLYVGRKDAKYRRVTNEKELLSFLQERGFEEVAMSGMSVADQAKLFSEAEAIVGPNGSALANLVFANPCCKVVEFFAPRWVVGFNWMIAANLGLDYTAIVGGGPRPGPGILPSGIEDDITIDLETVKRALGPVTAKTEA